MCLKLHPGKILGSNVRHILSPWPLGSILIAWDRKLGENKDKNSFRFSEYSQDLKISYFFLIV